jgi:hypothetical protein
MMAVCPDERCVVIGVHGVDYTPCAGEIRIDLWRLALRAKPGKECNHLIFRCLS